MQPGQGTKHERKYEGQYIVLDPSGNKKVVAFGPSSGDVVDKARRQGIDVPTIVFVPKSDTAYIY